MEAQEKILLIDDDPDVLEAMKVEIMEAICRYLDVDDQETVFRLERAQDKVALVSSVAVRRVIQRPPTMSPDPA